MLTNRDREFMCQRLKVSYKDADVLELFEEARREYRQIADPATSERDFVFGYVASSNQKITEADCRATLFSLGCDKLNRGNE